VFFLSLCYSANAKHHLFSQSCQSWFQMSRVTFTIALLVLFLIQDTQAVRQLEWEWKNQPEAKPERDITTSGSASKTSLEPDVVSSVELHNDSIATVTSLRARAELGMTPEQVLESPKYVYSDVDDTMKCSGAHWPAGMDSNGKKKQIYPGMSSLYLQLAMGPGKLNESSTIPPVIMLSARPASAAGLNKIGVSNSLRVKGDDPLTRDFQSKAPAWQPTWGLDLAEAQYGEWETIREFLKMGSPEFSKLGNAKYQQWVEHSLTNSNDGKKKPKITIMVGDNGQGDAVAALQMASSDNERAPLLAGGFVHHVQNFPFGWHGLSPTPGNESFGEGAQSALAERGISLFMQYGHAACLALSRGFIQVSQYVDIMKAIQFECDGKWSSSKVCKTVRVEFQIPYDAESSIRSERLTDGTWSCNAPHDRSFPGADVLDPGMFYNSFGRWVVGALCTDLTDTFVERLMLASKLINEKGESHWTDERLREARVPPLVAYAILRGIHCPSCCSKSNGQTGCNDQGCDEKRSWKKKGFRLATSYSTHSSSWRKSSLAKAAKLGGKFQAKLGEGPRRAKVAQFGGKVAKLGGKFKAKLGEGPRRAKVAQFGGKLQAKLVGEEPTLNLAGREKECGIRTVRYYGPHLCQIGTT